MFNVFIIGHDSSVYNMFHRQHNKGWELVDDPNDADFLVWTGGEDINPALYQEKCLRSTYFNERRDKIEIKFFDHFKNKNKIGICRGAQLLNVLSGGKLWQHVNNHGGLLEHSILDETFTGLPGYDRTKQYLKVNTCHHQMMIPGPGGQVLAVANNSTFRVNDKGTLETKDFPEWSDAEVVWYEKTSSFCFQAHPEWDHQLCHDYFFARLHQTFQLDT